MTGGGLYERPFFLESKEETGGHRPPLQLLTAGTGD
jgi:hypothetical protein